VYVMVCVACGCVIGKSLFFIIFSSLLLPSIPTTTPQCCSASSFATALGPVRNPWNEEYAAGGSSSGCGALVRKKIGQGVGVRA